MENITDKKPCNNCFINKYCDINKPKRWQDSCEACLVYTIWRDQALKRLELIESMLGSEYELEDLKNEQENS